MVQVAEKLLSTKETLSSNTSTTKKKKLKSLSIQSGYEKIKEKGHKVLVTEMKKGGHYIFCEQ
jgi:hypothetical protein